MSVLSVHLVEGSPLPLLRTRLDPREREGMTWARTLVTAALPARFPPRPHGAALLAAWQNDAALDRFLADDPLASRLADGWHVRLEPLRAYGSWPELPGLGQPERPVDEEEPVAILTLGRLRLRRALPFLRASSPAERQAAQDPAVMLVTGLARPPRIVATFSVWRSAREMRDYAVGRSGRAHLNATHQHRRKPFHHESIFARFRPYAAQGTWKGLSPLTARG